MAELWDAALDDLRADGRLVAETREGPSDAVLTPLRPDLHDDVRGALARVGIDALYSHQSDAVAAAWAGPTIVTTGTASGKSLCFQLPTLDVLCRDPRARAIYLYPTKALAQDQARSLATFGLGRMRAAVYDGDTPREARAQIRRRASIVLTNPDMLHVGILPNHHAWGDLFCNLAVVVIDEAHVYRGVFGSHVANVLRRLRRIAAAYGTEPRFLLASATIANPLDLAQRLTGFDEVALIDEDGAPAPRRRIAMLNPPLTDEALGERRSALSEAADLLVELVCAGARTICFAKSRKGVEVLARLVAAGLRERDASLADKVAPYRAGYTSGQRRELEARLASGELRAVITTDALELGIDIGALDAAVVVNFPGTVASLRQMWGRAGRRGHGLAVYVAGEDALDQFFCRHPDELLSRPVEAAILDHESPQIHLAHLRCAAFEGPLSGSDAQFLGPRWEAGAEQLVREGVLRVVAGDGVRARHYLPRRPEEHPASMVSLRSAIADRVRIVDVSSGELLGHVETPRAPSTVHEGAVYLHLGRSYEVVGLDFEGRTALVAPFDGDWYTQPKTDTQTAIHQLLDRRESCGVQLSFGEVAVTERTLAYQRKRAGDHRPIDVRGLDLPAMEFATQALWYELPAAELMELVGSEGLLGTLHATEHAQIAVLPLLAMCDRWDIGGLSTDLHPQTGCPTIFIYDGHPGGIGIARHAFAHFEELVAGARRLIGGCRCERGCPSCVQSPKCGNLNEPLFKAGALELLAQLSAASAASVVPRAPAAAPA